MITNHRKHKILIVDDDPRLRELLNRFLVQHNFDVVTANDGTQLNQVLLSVAIDLIVLDVMMPLESGLEICQRLRSNSVSTPIIMLTAKSEEHDRITGLEVGADDYLSKPFNPRELLARIQAVLRRSPALEQPGAPASTSESIVFGDFLFDMALRKLSRNGQDLALTTGEFAMLKALVRHPGQPLSREKLAQLTRGRDIKPSDRSLDVQISRLRRLIEDDVATPRYLQTVWGIGYVFVPDGKN